MAAEANARLADDVLRVAVAAARDAGRALLAGFGRPVPFHLKSHRNYATPLDAEAEALIVQAIRGEFPTHSILAEEAGDLPGDPDFQWIVDPLSSTRNYVHSLPHWAVCITFQEAGIAQVAVVLDPFYDELFTAIRGRGAFRNGAKLAVSGPELQDSPMVCATFDVEGDEGGATISAGLDYVRRLAGWADLRSLGSSALHMAYVAAGRLDGFVTNDTDTFTMAGGTLLVEEAGGRATDFRGNPWRSGAVGMVASNGIIHARLLETVSPVGL